MTEQKEISGTNGRKTRKFCILLVEDAESILYAIRDYLFNEFKVITAENAESALEQIKEENLHIDMAICDINLPGGIDGFDLLDILKKRDENIKTALITSYNINDYISLIREKQVDQIISKHSNLSLHFIYVMIRKLLEDDIFGVSKYFNDIRIYYPSELDPDFSKSERVLYSITIKSTRERVYWSELISDHLRLNHDIPESLSKLVLDELTTNAMIRAPRYEDGSFKYQKRHSEKDLLIPEYNIELDPEDFFTLQFGWYDDWVIIACTDPNGTLSKREIIYRLDRHISADSITGLPEGWADSHGRGIFLLREQVTNLIFNLQKDRRTEVICLINRKHDSPYKNISIFETE